MRSECEASAELSTLELLGPAGPRGLLLFFSFDRSLPLPLTAPAGFSAELMVCGLGFKQQLTAPVAADLQLVGIEVVVPIVGEVRSEGLEHQLTTLSSHESILRQTS